MDEEDIDYEDGFENMPPPPQLTTSQRRIVELASKNFNVDLVNKGPSYARYPIKYLNLYKGLLEALKLRILFEGPPDPGLKGPDLKGGFAHVYPVDLQRPREVLRKVIFTASIH